MSPRGIILTDSLTSQLIENVSIYRYAQRGVGMSAQGLIGLSCLNLSSTAFFVGSAEPQFPSSVKWAGGMSCLPMLLM